MPPYCLRWTSCHSNTERLKWIINQNTKQGISWDFARFFSRCAGFGVGPGESSEAPDAEAPGPFDDHLNRGAAHFEASQLKFNRRDFTFNKMTTTGEGGLNSRLAQAAISEEREGGGEVLKREREELRRGGKDEATPLLVYPSSLLLHWGQDAAGPFMLGESSMLTPPTPPPTPSSPSHPFNFLLLL